MSRELLEQVKAVIMKAQKLGAQGIRASIGRSRDSRVEWRDGKVDRLRESTSMGLNVTLYVDGRYSASSTSDFRPAAIDKFLEESIGMTRLLAEDPHRKLPDPGRFQGMHAGDLELHDERGAAAVTGIDRRRAAEALEKAVRAGKGADRIISVSTTSSDSRSESAMATSNGMQGSRETTTFVLVANASVRDEGDRKPRGYDYAVTRGRDKLKAVEAIGMEAMRRAMMCLGEKPEKTGEYPCVIENRVLGRLLSGLAYPLSGQAIQQKRSFLADKKGKSITSEALTVMDDPHVVEGLGSRVYDSEGMATRRMPILDKGVLKSFFIDTYYGSKLGMDPTTGSSTNTVFTSGDKDLAGLLAAMGTGLFVTGFIGGNSNSATGDFSLGIRGHWVEGGKLIRPVAEMNLSGNHLDFWKKLSETGNDPNPYSSWRIPSMRFDKVQFSGV